MYDLFIQLGIAFFTIEIIRRAFELYMVLSIRWDMKQHDKYCEDCADEILAETFKKVRERDDDN